MNIGTQIIRYAVGFALVAIGLHNMLTPTLAGIPLMLGGLALLAANEPAVDRFVVGLENWRHARSQTHRGNRW